MKATEQTLQQIERAIRKVADKFPNNTEDSVLTDIHLRVQWIDNKDDNFYEEVATVLRSVLTKQKNVIEAMSILKPYSFVLEDDDHEHIAELYLVDDDTAIMDQELMAGLDKDLDSFLDKLLKD